MSSFPGNAAQGKTMLYKITKGSWESVGTDIFTINNKYYPSIVDYYTKLPVIKQVEGLSANNLIQTCTTIFSEYGLTSRIVSDAGTNIL